MFQLVLLVIKNIFDGWVIVRCPQNLMGLPKDIPISIRQKLV